MVTSPNVTLAQGAKTRYNLAPATRQKWHHQWGRLIVHLDTLHTRPSGSHWSTHVGLKAHKFLENNQGLGLQMHNVPRKRLDFGVLNAHKLPRTKAGTQSTRASREKLGLGLKMHWFPGRASAVPLPLLICRRPLFCRCETMWDLPLEGFRKPLQDNAMEPQGSAVGKWQQETNQHYRTITKIN